MLGGRSCSESLLVIHIQSRTEYNLLEEQTIDLHAITMSDTKVWGGSLWPWWAAGFAHAVGAAGAGRQLQIKSDRKISRQQEARSRDGLSLL